MTERAKTVGAVIVTYHPEPGPLEALLRAVAPQVDGVIVVDNTGGAGGQLPVEAAASIEVMRLPCNAGLAAAQNIGIGWARRGGFGHVLLLDQDSLPAEGMVAVLRDALAKLGARAGAVGPRFHDLEERGDAPFVRIGFPLNRKLHCAPGRETLSCDFLIGSGTLVPLAVLDRVGDMDAELFIDNVDLEWCFRAKAMGYELYGICGARMRHRLGDARLALPLGLGQVVVHGPQRLYYMMRNRVRLYRLPHTPRVWVAQDLPRVLVKLFLFGVLVAPRGRNLRYMLRGLWDGVRGRSKSK
jgi:rhamnosyltransferase